MIEEKGRQDKILMNRIRTIAELSLLGMKPMDEVQQLYKFYGKSETIKEIKKSGFYSALKECL